MTIRRTTNERRPAVTGERRGAVREEAGRFLAGAVRPGLRAALVDRWPLLAGLLLFWLALLPRVVWLGAQSLWLDEGSTWDTIQQSWGRLLLDLVSPYAAYPLYHLLLKGWTGLAGDSEWALRFPSTLASAGAVVALFFAAAELQRWMRGDAWRTTNQPDRLFTTRRELLFPLAAALLLLSAPFALWYAQEAKVYSLLLLAAILLFVSLLRALRRQTRRAWLIFGALALSSLFVHRLAVLLLLAAWIAILLTTARRPFAGERQWTRPVAWLLAGLAGAGVVAAMVWGLGSEQAETGAYIAAGPLRAPGLTFMRFSVDRWPGEFPWWWLAAWIALTVWGGISSLYRAMRPGAHATRVLLCFLLVPSGLFLAQLAFTRLYEARYLMLVYPAWLLLLAYPLLPDAPPRAARRSHLVRAAYGCLFAAALATNLAVLIQPERGLFSGDPVKEQYREAVRELAVRVHPDDLVVVHPAYVRPLYDYYMQRFTADPAPQPVFFDAFKQGQTEFSVRDWDDQRRQRFAGFVRSFLLIAPEHARTVDVPVAGDEYGLLGLYFQYSREQQKWPCGIWRFNGVHLFCQDSPEAYETGAVLQPETRLPARFGDDIRLLGYTLKPTTPPGTGTYRAGGTLPLTLFWDINRPIDRNYNMFLHLCRDCELPPAASQDGPPLEGYLPTGTWLPANPVHDERSIDLPADLPPGRYTLLLGMYHPENPAPEARLPVHAPDRLSHNRLVLGTVEIIAPE